MNLPHKNILSWAHALELKFSKAAIKVPEGVIIMN